ncbi:MAG TPA: hypothetical protein VJ623_01520 [Holophagaceae bacterium]|nr:hypothetical protein [Holophagaceae bacterium]
MKPVPLSPSWCLPLAAAGLMGLGWLESHTPVTLTFSSYFFIPVALAAWSGGRYWGIAFAVLTGITWLAADLAMGFPQEGQLMNRAISVANHCMAYGLAAWMVDGLHVALKEIQDRNAMLKETLAEVDRLQDLLPVCAWCRKVRDDHGLWQGVEGYLQGKGTKLTHGICPQCQEEARREVDTLKSQVITLFREPRS